MRMKPVGLQMFANGIIDVKAVTSGSTLKSKNLQL